jgi:hypothetical protein
MTKIEELRELLDEGMFNRHPLTPQQKEERKKKRIEWAKKHGKNFLNKAKEHGKEYGKDLIRTLIPH